MFKGTSFSQESNHRVEKSTEHAWQFGPFVSLLPASISNMSQRYLDLKLLPERSCSYKDILI